MTCSTSRAAQDLFHLIMVTCWHVRASLSGDLSLLSLCLHFTPRDYIRRNQNITQRRRKGWWLRIKTNFLLALHLPTLHPSPPWNFISPPPPSAVSMSLPVPQIRSQPIHKTLPPSLSLSVPVVSADSCHMRVMPYSCGVSLQVRCFLDFDLFTDLQTSEQQHIP